MKTLILAAGYAVRLKELTASSPKPLLKIGRQRIIDRILDKITAADGSAAISIITNAKFFEDFKSWAKGSRYSNRIALINDGSASNEDRLGAIKDMALAIEKMAVDNEDLLVIAGDNLFEFELKDFLRFARARANGVSVALHDINDYDAARRFGVVKLSDEKLIMDFEEKPEKPKSTLISTGIYYFPKDKVVLIKEYIKSSDRLDAPGYYIRWLSKNYKVYGFAFAQSWYDIGDMESYKRADGEYSKKEKGRDGKK